MRKSFILPLALSLFIMIPLSASADQFGMLHGQDLRKSHAD